MTDIKSVGAALRAVNESTSSAQVRLSATIHRACRLTTEELVLRIAHVLPLLASGDQFQVIALLIREFLAAPSNSHGRPLFLRNLWAILPRYLRDAVEMPKRIEPAAFALAIRRLRSANTSLAHAASARADLTGNLAELGALLSLSSAELKLLNWSYCADRDESGVLKTVLTRLPCADWADALSALSVLLDEPVAAIASCFFDGCRLRAMGLLDVEIHKEPTSLLDGLVVGQALVELLEASHPDANALIDALRAPRPPWFLSLDHCVPPALLSEWFERPVASMFETSLAGRPLDAEQLVTAVAWLTGWYLPVETCEPLSERLHFESVELAVRRRFVGHALRGQPVDVAAVLRALNAAALV